MSNMEAVAPKKAVGEAREFIDMLWDSFSVNYDAFVAGDVPMEKELIYQLFSAPGPSQYCEFQKFFDLFEGGKDYIGSLKDQMYMHDFADVDSGAAETGSDYNYFKANTKLPGVKPCDNFQKI